MKTRDTWKDIINKNPAANKQISVFVWFLSTFFKSNSRSEALLYMIVVIVDGVVAVEQTINMNTNVRIFFFFWENVSGSVTSLTVSIQHYFYWPAGGAAIPAVFTILTLKSQTFSDDVVCSFLLVFFIISSIYQQDSICYLHHLIS